MLVTNKRSTSSLIAVRRRGRERTKTRLLKQEIIHPTQISRFKISFKSLRLTNLKNEFGVGPRIERERLIGWMKVKSPYPLLFEKVNQFIFGFLTTWFVKARFSVGYDIHQET